MNENDKLTYNKTLQVKLKRDVKNSHIHQRAHKVSSLPVVQYFIIMSVATMGSRADVKTDSRLLLTSTVSVLLNQPDLACQSQPARGGCARHCTRRITTNQKSSKVLVVVAVVSK